LRLDRKGIEKEVLQINDTIIIRAKNNPCSSGFLFMGTNEAEMWGISRKYIYK
jgi:hypothetical protein